MVSECETHYRNSYFFKVRNVISLTKSGNDIRKVADLVNLEIEEVFDILNDIDWYSQSGDNYENSSYNINY